MAAVDQAALVRETLRSLEARLTRLHFVLHGDDHGPGLETTSSEPIANRFQRVDKALSAFEAQTSSLQELLRRHREHIVRTRAQQTPAEGDEHISGPLVLSYADEYKARATQLRAIQDAPLGDAGSLVDAIAQQSRLQRALARAVAQDHQIARLEADSAELINRWHSVAVLGVGEAWSEWESRLLDGDRAIRQKEAKQRRDTEAV